MNTHRKISNSINFASLTISFFLILIVALEILFLHKAAAIITSTILLLIISASFFRFMYAMLINVWKRTTIHVILFIAVNTASMIALFANLYRWTGIIDTIDTSGNTRSFWRALYFSIVTWTTLGYGDVLPKPNSRPIAAVEAISGYIVMALLIVVLQLMAQAGARERERSSEGSVPDK